MKFFDELFSDVIFYWLNRLLPSKQSQESITTSTQAQCASQACSTLITNSLSKLIKCFLRPFGALSMEREKPGELFCKNLSSVGAFLAEETTYIKDEMNLMLTQRQVMQRPVVMALDVQSGCSAELHKNHLDCQIAIIEVEDGIRPNQQKPTNIYVTNTCVTNMFVVYYLYEYIQTSFDSSEPTRTSSETRVDAARYH